MGYNRTAPHAFPCECGDHCWARLSRGYVVLVSPEDAHLLQKHKYSALPKPPKNQPKSKVHYRVTVMHSVKGIGTVMIHREIMQPPDNLVVDHANRNCLDNRRSNLRVCTISENGANSRKPVYTRKMSSRFKGVWWYPRYGKWEVRVEKNGKVHYAGRYFREEDAGAAYLKKSQELNGEFARAL